MPSAPLPHTCLVGALYILAPLSCRGEHPLPPFVFNPLLTSPSFCPPPLRGHPLIFSLLPHFVCSESYFSPPAPPTPCVCSPKSPPSFEDSPGLSRDFWPPLSPPPILWEGEHFCHLFFWAPFFAPF